MSDEDEFEKLKSTITQMAFIMQMLIQNYEYLKENFPQLFCEVSQELGGWKA